MLYINLNFFFAEEKSPSVYKQPVNRQTKSILQLFCTLSRSDMTKEIKG